MKPKVIERFSGIQNKLGKIKKNLETYFKFNKKKSWKPD